MAYIEDPFGTHVSALAGGMDGTMQTVIVMQRLAVQGSMSPMVRQAAEDAVRGLPARNWKAEARAVENWVKRRLRYTHDGLNVETLKTPQSVLAEAKARGRFTGDCDDASILMASMLLTIGHNPAFLLLGRSDTPHHVCVRDESTGLVLDPTAEPRGPFGYVRAFPVTVVAGV